MSWTSDAYRRYFLICRYEAFGRRVDGEWLCYFHNQNEEFGIRMNSDS